MKNTDIMVKLRIQLTRDGTVGMSRIHPSGPITAHNPFPVSMSHRLED
jgi:hypothetical protein